MRIIGGKDYYDSGLAYGRDESLVFVRRRHSTAEPMRLYDVPLKYPSSLPISGSRDTFMPLYVWFAGKRYGGVLYNSAPNYGLSRSYEITNSHLQQRWFWNCKSFLAFLAEKKIFLRNELLSTEKIGKHFSGNGSDIERDWLIENGVAIVIPHISYGKQEGWFLNTDGLKSIDFVKALDPFTAFQELSMFVGGVMARPDRPIVEITDNKVVAAKHGFDEWSFRKPGAR